MSQLGPGDSPHGGPGSHLSYPWGCWSLGAGWDSCPITRSAGNVRSPRRPWEWGGGRVVGRGWENRLSSTFIWCFPRSFLLQHLDAMLVLLPYKFRSSLKPWALGRQGIRMLLCIPWLELKALYSPNINLRRPGKWAHLYRSSSFSSPVLRLYLLIFHFNSSDRNGPSVQSSPFPTSRLALKPWALVFLALALDL